MQLHVNSQKTMQKLFNVKLLVLLFQKNYEKKKTSSIVNLSGNYIY